MGAAVLFALTFGGLGCEGDPKRSHSLPEATSPDRLVELLAGALGERDFQLCESLLHDDFQFESPEDERILSGTSDGRWALPSNWGRWNASCLVRRAARTK